MSLADKLQEEKNKDALTIRKIRDIVRASHDVWVKPAGRRLYFLGEMKDIPDSLLDLKTLPYDYSIFTFMLSANPKQLAEKGLIQRAFTDYF